MWLPHKSTFATHSWQYSFIPKRGHAVFKTRHGMFRRGMCLDTRVLSCTRPQLPKWHPQFNAPCNPLHEVAPKLIYYPMSNLMQSGVQTFCYGSQWETTKTCTPAWRHGNYHDFRSRLLPCSWKPPIRLRSWNCPASKYCFPKNFPLGTPLRNSLFNYFG